ncbi:MAG: VIT1/CCC1 transporter family protein [Verrucomicrobiales bacterium]
MNFRSTTHSETHLVARIGWLRAAVMGANDGIVSTAILIVGVVAASGNVVLAGVAGLVARAMSMAAGEYVSVSTQSDTEQADLTRERGELTSQPEFELEELARIYVSRGIEVDLARKVAEQLTAHDAIGAHAREELGISEVTAARPSLRYRSHRFASSRFSVRSERKPEVRACGELLLGSPFGEPLRWQSPPLSER